jgi:hypothetical protein
MNHNSQSNTILNDDIRKKPIKKKRKIIESIGLTIQTRDSGHETGTTQ